MCYCSCCSPKETKYFLLGFSFTFLPMKNFNPPRCRAYSAVSSAGLWRHQVMEGGWMRRFPLDVTVACKSIHIIQSNLEVQEGSIVEVLEGPTVEVLVGFSLRTTCENKRTLLSVWYHLLLLWKHFEVLRSDGQLYTHGARTRARTDTLTCTCCHYMLFLFPRCKTPQHIHTVSLITAMLYKYIVWK